MLNWRHLTLAIAFALVNAASPTGAARAGESGLFSPGFPPWPAPPNSASGVGASGNAAATAVPGRGSVHRKLSPSHTFGKSRIIGQWKLWRDTMMPGAASMDRRLRLITGSAG
jgi:hypothetical protein